jgi:succinyl-CoA synthetase beta subunit
VPESSLVTGVEQLRSAVTLAPPRVLKAQVLIGGRGKAGGVLMWEKQEDLKPMVERLLAMDIRGERVRAVLVEEKASIEREYYMSIVFNGTRAMPMLVASEVGGVDIERVAHETPERITTLEISPLIGPSDYQVRTIAKAINCKDVSGLRKIVAGLWTAFTKFDATLVEVNPLAVTPKGMICLDGKMVIDEKATYRQGELLAELSVEQKALPGCREDEVRADTITYVPLTGTVGLISDGAGTGMLTLDLIRDAGGEAADFCEMGGLTSPQVMYDAMKVVLADTKVKSLLVVLIGGFNRMDEMAEGIIRYRDEFGLKVPVAIRMCGTMEQVGLEMMRKAGISTSDDLLDAVSAAVDGASDAPGGVN